MKRLLLFCLFVAGCTGTNRGEVGAGGLVYGHDAAHGVSCWGWQASYSAISCLPDKDLP